VDQSVPARDVESALRAIVKLVLAEERQLQELKLSVNPEDMSVQIRNVIHPDLFSQMQRDSEGETRGRVEQVLAELTDTQRAVLVKIIEQGPNFRDSICPGRLVSSSSARALERRGLVIRRGYPVTGWQLSSLDGAMAAELIAQGDH
jgi:hypothetical protein